MILKFCCFFKIKFQKSNSQLGLEVNYEYKVFLALLWIEQIIFLDPTPSAVVALRLRNPVKVWRNTDMVVMATIHGTNVQESQYTWSIGYRRPVAHPEFPSGCTNPWGGANILFYPFFSKKLHENEENLAKRGSASLPHIYTANSHK